MRLPAEAWTADEANCERRCTYFVVDGSYHLETFLDLPADQFKFLRNERTTECDLLRCSELLVRPYSPSRWGALPWCGGGSDALLSTP